MWGAPRGAEHAQFVKSREPDQQPIKGRELMVVNKNDGTGEQESVLKVLSFWFHRKLISRWRFR